MNNKASTATTKKDGNPEWKPRLRFPEFCEGPSWGLKKIGSMLAETPRPIKLEDETEYCLVTVKRRYGGLISRGILKGNAIKVNSQFLVKEGDFLISKRQIVHNACGLVPQSLDGSVVSNEYSVLTPKSGCSIEFINWFAQQPCVSASFLQCSVGIVIEKMLFNLNAWLKREFLFPSLKEQQKIADCLTSVDELIAAQSRKLDGIKTHKKGLMQKLFPRKGETQPNFRFPEFQNAGEWESAPLGQLLVGSPDYGVNAAAVPYSEGLPKYLRITDISEDGTYLSDKMASVDIEPTEGNYLEEGDIALARTGASVGKSYRYRKEDGRLVFAGFLIRIRPAKKKLVSAYLAIFLTTGQYWDWVAVTSARSGQPGINSTEYSSLSIPLPPGNLAEQQRIADCLTRLDDVITGQTQKLAALKTHTQALMQQLFPFLEEVEA